MHMHWNDPHERPYKTGDLYAGVCLDHGCEVGVPTERHALTIAGAGSGKGAGIIIPNLLRWPQSALVIDPKGEAADETAEKREAMGQRVHVLDPFNGCKKVPPHLKARFNPLDAIDPDGFEVREEIENIAAGLVMRHSEKDEYWNYGAQTVLAGMIAHIASRAPADMRNLQALRMLMRKDLGELVEDMQDNDACDGLVQDAVAALMKSPREAEHFLSGADSNTRWLDSRGIKSVMESSTFNLNDLKQGNTTVYLVIPRNYLKTHGRFLRLFVMAAIQAMGKGSTRSNTRCLMILDEFFSLGYIDEIAVASGQMRSYGLSLWPFLQSLGQLYKTYDHEIAEDFFANADLVQFFGISDQFTAAKASEYLGAVDLSEVDEPPPALSNMDMGISAASQLSQFNLSPPRRVAKDSHTGRNTVIGGMVTGGVAIASFLNERAKAEAMQNYQHQMRLVGSARVTAGEVRELTTKDGEGLAPAQIVFIKSKAYLLGLRGWWETATSSLSATAPPSLHAPAQTSVSRPSHQPVYQPDNGGWFGAFAAIGGLLMIGWFAAVLLAVFLRVDTSDLPPNIWNDVAGTYYVPIALFWLLVIVGAIRNSIVGQPQ